MYKYHSYKLEHGTCAIFVWTYENQISHNICMNYGAW